MIERLLRPVFAASLRVTQFFALICCAGLAAATVSIVFDVTVRNFGGQPPQFTNSFVEYVLLYVALLGAPYLVRYKGHIVVEALIDNVGERAHLWMARFVYFVCFAVCVWLAWVGAKQTWVSWSTNDMEFRSFDAPRWILDITLPLGFGLSAVEFLRYIVGYDTLFRVQAIDKDGF